ncbi:FAD dependent oxidoreductase [Trichoderma evansii]
MASGKHVVIIGAGVLGLSSALELVQKGYRVTVLASDLPGDQAVNYASPKAGAHFRPTPVITDQDAFENKLMHETFSMLKDLSVKDKAASVEFIPAVEYFEKQLKPEDLEMFSAWPEFRCLEQFELPSNSSIKAGLTYSAWVLNSPVYLTWLQNQAESHGAVFLRKTLNAAEEAFFVAAAHVPSISPPVAIINASGRGFGDEACFPSRGQFILISNEYDRTISHHSADGHSTVIIPRPLGGGTVIGGTKEPHNWSPYNSEAAVKEILQRVTALCPDMLQAPENAVDTTPALHVKEAYIGRRPMRKGGLRLEIEMIDLVQTGQDGLQNNSTKFPIIHCYGAGPSGYKVSLGVAKKVYEMVKSL